MIDTLWIHIGMGKTGTSAIQGYFDAAGDRLEKECGVRYLSAGRVNRAHQLLSPTYRRAQNTEWRRCLQEMEAELKSGACHSGIISSEFLCWDDEEFCRQMRAHIPSTRVRIVLFVREIGDLLYASFLQRVKSRPAELAGQEYQFGPYLKRMGPRFDFSARLAPWLAAFGRDAIVIVDYDRMEVRDSAATMCATIGIPHWSDVEVESSENGSLSGEDLELLRFLEKQRPMPPAMRKELVAFLISRGGRTRTLLPASFRPRVEALYADLDDAFRKEYGLLPRLSR